MKNIFNSNNFSLMLMVQASVMVGFIFYLFVGISSLSAHESSHEELVSRIQNLELLLEQQQGDRAAIKEQKDGLRRAYEADKKWLDKESDKAEKEAENKVHRIGSANKERVEQLKGWKERLYGEHRNNEVD